MFNEKKAWVMNIKNIQGKRDWQTHEMECTTPENAFYGEIRLLLVFDKQGTCWFTDIQVHEMPRGDQFANRIMSIPYYPADVPENQIFDPSIWKHSTRFSDFLIPAANTRAHNQTEAEAFYTDNAIYLIDSQIMKISIMHCRKDVKFSCCLRKRSTNTRFC